MRQAWVIFLSIACAAAGSGCGSDEGSSNPGTSGGGGAAGGGGAGGSGGSGGLGGSGGSGGLGGSGGSGGLGGASGAAGSAGSAGAYTPPAFGSPQQITSLTGGKEGRQATLLPDGTGYALVWARSGPDLAEFTREVNLTRLNATGTPEWTKPITGVVATGGSPRLAVGNGGYAVVFVEDGGVGETKARLVQFAADGTPATPILVTDQAKAGGLNPRDPKVVFTGTGYSVLWTAQDNSGALPSLNSGVFMARFDLTGTMLGDPTVIADTGNVSTTVNVAWTGNGYGAVWSAGTSFELYFANIGVNGTPSTPIKASPGVTGAVSQSITWSGTEFGLAWIDDRTAGPARYDVWASRLGAQGAVIGTPQRLTTGGFGGDPSIAWTGTEYGIAWSWYVSEGVAEPPSIQFGAMGSDGQKLGTAKLFETKESTPMPSLVWANGGYALAWHSPPASGGTERQVFFTKE